MTFLLPLSGMCPETYSFIVHIKISLNMTKKIYSLCEAVADITSITTCEGYKTDNRREMISQFIE